MLKFNKHYYLWEDYPSEFLKRISKDYIVIFNKDRNE